MDTVYCISLSRIVRRLTDLFKILNEGKKRLHEKGKENSPAVVKYKDMVANKDKLFDVFLEDKTARINQQEE